MLLVIGLVDTTGYDLINVTKLKDVTEYNTKSIPNLYTVPLCGCIIIYHTNKSEKVNLGKM
jgi:hypothetical protein